LTAKALDRLTSQFKKELQRRPNEEAGVDMDRRYKGILDSVRVRQRKLFRFSRQLTNTFENTTEYSINMAPHLLQELYDNLQISGHVLVNITTPDNERISVLASPGLAENQAEIVSIAGTCYRADNAPNDAQNPYVLLLFPEEQLSGQAKALTWTLGCPRMILRLANFAWSPKVEISTRMVPEIIWTRPISHSCVLLVSSLMFWCHSAQTFPVLIINCGVSRSRHSLFQV